MLFWFNQNEAFSLIDALVKLILVITASILIICFCHRITNYKKSRPRRYKSNSSLNFAVTAIASNPNGQTPFLTSTRTQDQTSRQLMAFLSTPNGSHISPVYDPYAQLAIIEAQIQSQNSSRDPLSQSLRLQPEIRYQQICQSNPQAIIQDSRLPEEDQCPTYEEAIAASQAQSTLATGSCDRLPEYHESSSANTGDI